MAYKIIENIAIAAICIGGIVFTVLPVLKFKLISIVVIALGVFIVKNNIGRG